MATAVAAKRRVKDIVFEWEGKDKNGKTVRGEMRAGGEAMVSASLRRQGVMVTKVKKRRMSGGKSIKQKDIAVFTRQLSTMMKRRRAADPVVRHRRPRQHEPEADAAAHRHPLRRRDRHQPVGRVPQAPAATSTPCTATWSRPAKRAVSWKRLLDRLAIYQEKTMAIKNKIKSALIYPIAVHRGRVRRADGHHDLRHPGVRGRVQVVRRRPAGADARRHRDVEVLRHATGT